MKLKEKIHLLNMIQQKGKCVDLDCTECIFNKTIENEYCCEAGTTDQEMLIRVFKVVEGVPLHSIEEIFEENL